MWTQSEKCRAAIFEKLNVDAVTDLAPVFHCKAPTGTNFPFVVFDRVPGTVARAMAGNVVLERDLWSIKALTESDESKAQQILAACETAIGNEIVIEGKVFKVWRRMDMPNFAEVLTDREIYNRGFYLAVNTV